MCVYQSNYLYWDFVLLNFISVGRAGCQVSRKVAGSFLQIPRLHVEVSLSKVLNPILTLRSAPYYTWKESVMEMYNCQHYPPETICIYIYICNGKKLEVVAIIHLICDLKTLFTHLYNLFIWFVEPCLLVLYLYGA